jgi:hypothetical protein
VDDDCTEVPTNRALFNPYGYVTILLNLTFAEQGEHGHMALLHMTWRAPELPQPGSILRIGAGKHELVIAFPEEGFFRRLFRPRRLVWNEDRNVEMDATLLHVASPRDFLKAVEGMIAGDPEYAQRLRAVLHITTAVRLLEEDA